MYNKNIKYIHILKNKLCAKFGLSDETYRALLQDNYSVNSSKDLSLIQQKELKDMMSAVSIRTGRAKVSISLLNHQVFSIKRKNALSLKQENFIIFLSQGRPLGKNTVTDVLAFCSKIIKKKISTLQDLSKQEAITIINALQRCEPWQSPLAPKTGEGEIQRSTGRTKRPPTKAIQDRKINRDHRQYNSPNRASQSSSSATFF